MIPMGMGTHLGIFQRSISEIVGVLGGGMACCIVSERLLDSMGTVGWRSCCLGGKERE